MILGKKSSYKTYLAARYVPKEKTHSLDLFVRVKCLTAQFAIMPSAIFEKYHKDVARHCPCGRVAEIVCKKIILAIGVGRKRHVDG